MPILLPCFAEPPENVLQGAQDQSGVLALPFTPIALNQIVECDMIPIGQMPVLPIPPAIINPLELMGYLPRTIGPMVNSPDGSVQMLLIGAPSVNPIINPIQIFVNSGVPVDATGIMASPALPILSQPDQTLNQVPDIQIDTIISWPYFVIPKPEIIQSGSLRTYTCPVLPPSFGRHLTIGDFMADPARFIISGVTSDYAANPLAGCTVIVFSVWKLTVNTDASANPIETTTVSDGSGNYSVNVSGRGPYQVVAYLHGSPDVAGVTLNTITPAIG